MRRLLCAAVSFLFLAPVGAGAEVTVRLEPEYVRENQSFLIVVQSSGKRVGEPVMPELEGVTIDSTPRNTSQSFKVVITGMDMEQVAVKERGYRAWAPRAGRYTLPAVRVNIDGKMEYSEPLAFTVHEAAAGPAAEPRREPRSGGPDHQRQGLTWDDLVFITSNVDKTEVYEGEPVRVHLELWKILLDEIRIEDSQRTAAVNYPVTEGFYVVPLEQSTEIRMDNNYRYEVTDYGLMAYPTRADDLVIGSWHWEGRAYKWTWPWGWFGAEGRAYALSTPEITVRVKPLPDRPSNFTGAVGEFSVEARLTRDEVLQGVPTQLTIRITGQGNPDAIGDPHLPDLENVYVDGPEKETRSFTDADGVVVEKDFVYSIAPLQAGDLHIPEIGFCYFDPTDEDYATKTVGPFVVHVLAVPKEQRRSVLAAEAQPPSQKPVEVLHEDILDIITEPGTLRPSRTSPFSVLVVVIAPATAYSGFALVMRRRRRFARDIGLARAHYAKSKSRRRLSKVARAKEPAEELYRAVLGFIADKFNIPEAGMTSADAERLFQARGLDSELAGNLLKTLRACERVRYGSGRLSDDELRALIKGAAVNMDRLDHALRGGKRQ